MHLRHERNSDGRVLAGTVDTADSVISQMRGLMFRRSLPDDYALVFRFDAVGKRDVHMLFVFEPLDVLWIIEEEVVRSERLDPWTGVAVAEADTLVELPAGGANDVSVGDAVFLVE